MDKKEGWHKLDYHQRGERIAELKAQIDWQQQHIDAILGVPPNTNIIGELKEARRRDKNLTRIVSELQAKLDGVRGCEVLYWSIDGMFACRPGIGPDDPESYMKVSDVLSALGDEE